MSSPAGGILRPPQGVWLAVDIPVDNDVDIEGPQKALSSWLDGLPHRQIFDVSRETPLVPSGRCLCTVLLGSPDVKITPFGRTSARPLVFWLMLCPDSRARETRIW